MQILNAKPACLTFQLDNGTLLQIQPGECSKPFIATKSILFSVISLSEPTQVGIILTNPYEMDLLRDVSGAIAYLHNSESDARKVLLEGKTLESSELDTNPLTIVVEKLRQEKKAKEDEVNYLTEEIKNLNQKLSTSEAEQLKKELEIKSQELNRANSNVVELNGKIDQLNADKVDLEKKIKSQEEANKTLAYQLNEANDKLANAASVVITETPEYLELKKQYDELANKPHTDDPEVIENLQQELDKANGKLAEGAKQVEDLKATMEKSAAEAKTEFEKLTAENNSLKADGAKLVENYNKAKEALVSVMEKFNITWNGSEYVQETPDTKE